MGLFATDTRDKLYLSREVAQHARDVLLFTLESDLLYSHAQYGPYMRGTIVASTYSLFNATQRWTLPAVGQLGRQQFPSSLAHGVYNAAIVLLNYGRTGGRSMSVTGPPPLLDYVTPLGGACWPCAPPLWISVAGRDGLWPVSFSVDEVGPYLFPWYPPGSRPAGSSSHTQLRPSRVVRSAFVALVVVVLLHVVAFGLSTWRSGAPPLLSPVGGLPLVPSPVMRGECGSGGWSIARGKSRWPCRRPHGFARTKRCG